MIRVLIVEDSPTICEFLVHLLSSEPGFSVAGTASNGEEAIEAVLRLKPDVITMDIVMPRMNGLEATRRIMEAQPTPIVIVSAQVPSAEAKASFDAIEAGALAVVPRPVSFRDPSHEASVRYLVRTVKLMAEVKVVRRRPPAGREVEPIVPKDLPAAPVVDIIAIGGSTGAPLALERILLLLPETFTLPILVVQHIAPGFVESFGQWLGQSSGRRVRVAADGEPILPGWVYLAPDQLHLGVQPPGRILLSDSPPENGLRPAVSFLFHSLAVCFGARTAGVLLSGMGSDGASALRSLRDLGAVTMVQDKDSSVVFGMPGEALSLGAAGLVLSPDGIAANLAALDKAKRRHPGPDLPDSLR